MRAHMVVAGLILLPMAGTAQAAELEVQAQGGVLSFPGEVAEVTSVGAQWGVLVGLTPLPALGVELSYQGARYRTDVAPAPEQESLFENGAQAVAKVGPRFARIEPYALGGLALSHLDVREREGGPGIIQDGALLKVPVGVGVDIRIPMGRAPLVGEVGPSLLIGARGTYRFLLRDAPFDAVAEGRGADQLGATLNIGARF